MKMDMKIASYMFHVCMISALKVHEIYLSMK